ncbi:MAG: carotenoid biosynthesis protein [Candidatus Heimdallarchaeota archaeon]|nr:carotenoid biosynthesis protein [Candidatus Heimdallarchaeota archaeon]
MEEIQIVALTIIAWLFTIGTIVAFVALYFHCYLFYGRFFAAFVFIGGSSIAYLLEYSLAVQLDQYTYHNLPLAILQIPVTIALGWVITFYGLYHFILDLLPESKQSPRNIIFANGALAGIFGMGIETLARSVEFWEFHFESIKFIGIPVIVTLAWFLSVMIFTSAMLYVKERPDRWLPVLLITHFTNLAVGIGLTFFQVQ